MKTYFDDDLYIIILENKYSPQVVISFKIFLYSIQTTIIIALTVSTTLMPWWFCMRAESMFTSDSTSRCKGRGCFHTDDIS